jgi:hypothetical protein
MKQALLRELYRWGFFRKTLYCNACQDWVRIDSRYCLWPQPHANLCLKRPPVPPRDSLSNREAQ